MVKISYVNLEFFFSSSDLQADGTVFSGEDFSTGEIAISNSSETAACSSDLSKDSDSANTSKEEDSKEELFGLKENSGIVKGVEHIVTSPNANNAENNSIDCMKVTSDCNQQVTCEPDKHLGEALPNQSDEVTDTKPLELVPATSLPTFVKFEPSIKQEFPANKGPQIFLVQLPAGSSIEAFHDQVSSHLTTTETLKKKHFCSTCGKEFVCKATFEQHQLIHTGEKPHTCGFCNKTFSMKSNLERHEKRHTGIRPHLCELCGKGFIQKTALQYHMKIHEEEIRAEVYKQGEIYSCSACGLTFNRGANLRKHIQKVHLNQDVKVEQNDAKTHEKKSLLCDLCGKGFASVNSLKLHKMQHTGEKPFVCSVCSKAFVVKAQLQYHSRLHTGEKPFVCPTCGKGFVGKLGLTQHIRTHTGERPYICTVCGKGFTQSTHLKGHMRSHTGEKPNICHLCGKAYKNRLDLRFHYSRIHEMNITRPKPQIIKIEQSL